MKNGANIYLEEVVRYASNDLGEDYDKVKTRFRSWALRGLKELTNQHLSLGVRREIVPINVNTNSANIPCDAKKVNYVGIINECGEKISLTLNTKFVGKVAEKECVDKCKECGEDKDVCEQLNVIENTEMVSINGVPYEKNTIKRLIGNEYYEIINEPYLDIETNLVVFKERRNFISTLELNNCGCVKTTEQNIQVIKDNCYSCYSCCYAPCIQNSEDIGYYTVSMSDGLIHFNKDFGYNKVYIEYVAGLPKDEGKIILPEEASEVIAYYIAYKYKENNSKFSQGQVRDAFQMYVIKKKDMVKILSKINLEDLIRILHKTPRLALNMPMDNCDNINNRQIGKKVGDNIINNITQVVNTIGETDIAYDGWNL